MNLLKCYDDFIREKRAYCSADTVRYYELNLGEFFLGWLADREGFGGVSGLSSVESGVFCKSLFYDYLLHLREKEVKNVSVRTYFRSVKSFCGWLYDNEYIDRNYCKRMKMPGNDAAVKVPLSVAEVRRIDESIGFSGRLGVRNYCIVHLMLDCGLRLGEVCGLRVGEVDFENGYLNFIGKGSKRRIVPCPGFLLAWIRCYLDDFRRSSSDFLFLDVKKAPITKNAVKVFVGRLKKSSGVSRVHCHLLRHTFATSYIIGGGNLEYLRMLLGHSDIMITQKYLHCSSQVAFINMDIYELDGCFFRNIGYRR
ncbi:MAG: tyrosine-type recombinase/integrase [Lachnospiraceae bacterium]|nr:tyrosine-type recombinase/integrase [Lachnospiraceae bacterium]